VCVCESLGLFFNKSVCQQENSIDQRNIGSIVQKFFGTKFPKFARLPGAAAACALAG